MSDTSCLAQSVLSIEYNEMYYVNEHASHRLGFIELVILAVTYSENHKLCQHRLEFIRTFFFFFVFGITPSAKITPNWARVGECRRWVSEPLRFCPQSCQSEMNSSGFVGFSPGSRLPSNQNKIPLRLQLLQEFWYCFIKTAGKPVP